MTNEEYGITAIKLIFTIIILAVVIVGIVFVVKRLWQDTSIKNIETDLLYIKAKCKVILWAGSLGIDFRKESKSKASNTG